MGFFPNTANQSVAGNLTVTGSISGGAITASSVASTGAVSVGGTALPSKQADAGVAGFALQNATPTILSWTSPNDANDHRVTVQFTLDVTVAATGGAIGFTYTAPDGTVTTGQQILAGSQTTGTHLINFNNVVIKGNTTFSVVQTSALTVGTATAWCEIWGS